ncbi:MAG: response regulator [Massilia sp.]
MKAAQHPYTGISARPSTFSRLHWLNACARRRRFARAIGVGSDAGSAAPAAGNDSAAATRPRGYSGSAIPRVLHIDHDASTALALGCLLRPEASVTNVTTMADARAILQRELFSLIIVDPNLPDGDAAALLPLFAGTPVLVYAPEQPLWRSASATYLPKPWTSSRRLWTTISTMLGIAQPNSAGD